MRIAIACCGLEHVRRGYESFARELFDALSTKGDVVLFKGSGKSGGKEIVVPCIRRDFLERFMAPERAFYYEQISFAVALIPYLAMRKIDVLHYSEGNVGNALARLVRWTGLHVKLVQSNGGPVHPRHFRPEVFIHQVSKQGLDEATYWGVAPDRMSLIPYGIESSNFRTTIERQELRKQFDLPLDRFIILSLAAFKKKHKRIDYLIREVAALKDPSNFLCMAGEPTEDFPELKEIATRLLPNQHVFLTVPRREVPKLLASADLLVHGAVHEGFGMVLLEALSAGTPVMCHNSDHFKWVLGDAALYVDMNEDGALTAAIRKLRTQSGDIERLSALGKLRIDTLYDWNVIAARYFEMYHSAMKI